MKPKAGPDKRDKRTKKPHLKRKKRICQFCQQKFEPDFKDIVLLRQYISDRAKIQPQRSTGACATHQRALSRAIKRARHAGFVSYMVV